jgi:hypothetical protein
MARSLHSHRVRRDQDDGLTRADKYVCCLRKRPTVVERLPESNDCGSSQSQTSENDMNKPNAHAPTSRDLAHNPEVAGSILPPLLEKAPETGPFA